MKLDKQFKLHKACDQDKDGYRPSLKCVHYDGTTLVSIDGHIMAMVRPEAGSDEEGNIPMQAFSEVTKGKKGDAVLTTQDGKVIFGDNGSTQTMDLVDEPFPNWEQVLPTGIKEKPVMVLKFNVNLLKRLSEAMGSTNGEVTLYFGNSTLSDQDGTLTPTGPIPVEVDNTQADGILMPIRL